jgi:hypothetical protein
MAGKTQITVSREEQVFAVLKRIEEGESENSACKAEGINRATFRSAALRAQVADEYARALKGLAYDQVEQIEKLMEDLRSGKIDPQSARVIADTRKWFASKFLPRQFGDKLDVTSGNEKINRGVSDVELDAILSRRTDDKAGQSPQAG